MATKRQQVIDFMNKKSLVRPRDLVAMGLPKDYLYQLAKKGVVERVSRGLYSLPGGDISEWASFVEAQRRVPKGVFCLLSALAFHKFTTQNPHELWIAIANKAWRPEIDYPPVRFIAMSGVALDNCIEAHVINGVDIRVYSAAKTVADCFKFRSRVGLDVAIEALKEGWRHKKFTMDELMHCAELCRVANVIQPYAESVVHS
ncbi:type IV toxin-antitoxin system AbiEi family antitoxin domain-containing protein [Dasania marina]|uniref:type IV toxin-antitoxin system AbiEi family antitoxin domain-containing protein n=1 Tax=Dasania marina TaxID=471499 RepID=UPI0030D9D939|tara:strand:+ start:60019 stop:60624 length:606 start_codon:yes stop_codon:yes gene_type:complete